MGMEGERCSQGKCSDTPLKKDAKLSDWGRVGPLKQKASKTKGIVVTAAPLCHCCKTICSSSPADGAAMSLDKLADRCWYWL